MKPPSLASLLSLVTALAVASACTDDEPAGVFVEFRLEPKPEAEGFRPDQIDFHWLRAGQSEPTRHRLPRGGGAVSTTDSLLYRVFIEAPAPLTEQRLLTAVGLRGEAVVSGGVLVLQPDDQRVRYETVVLRDPLPDEDNDQIPDAVEGNCLAGDWRKCYPPGVEPPPPPPDSGPPDEAAPADAGADGEPADAPEEVGPPVDVAPEVPSNPLLADLVGHWRMDDGMGAVVRDWSGRNNDGALVGNASTLWIPSGMGRWGGALNLPAGTGNGVIVSGTGFDGLQRAFTISAQTWRMSHRDNFATIVARRYMNGQNEYFNLHFLSGTARGIVNSHQPGGVTQGTVIAQSQAPLGNWVHVAMTYDGSFLRLYQNGVQVSMAPYTASVMGTGTPLTIGCGQNGSNNNATDEALGGRIDDVLIWSRSLNADEIRRVAMGEHLM